MTGKSPKTANEHKLEKLLELKARLSAQAEKDCTEADQFGFPFESMDEFSDTPLGFEEYTASLMEDLADVYLLTGRYNRFSPSYPEACTVFERLVHLLGRCCVTRAMLEQKGLRFEKLRDLHIGSLYACVSFNFRKCHAALQEGKEKKITDMKLLDLECRLYSLAERLKSTEEKICLIREGKIRADAVLNRECEFSLSTRKENDPIRRMASARKAAALPVLGSMARELYKQKKQKYMLNTFGPFPSAGMASSDFAADVTDPDIAAVIRTAREEAFLPEEPFRSLPAPNVYEGPDRRSLGPESGPSREVRSKLREKRKKKTKRV